MSINTVATNSNVTSSPSLGLDRPNGKFELILNAKKNTASLSEKLLSHAVKDTETINEITKSLLSNQKQSASQLIGSQVLLYKAVMGVTTVAKVAELSSNAAKTVMQQNV